MKWLLCIFEIKKMFSKACEYGIRAVLFIAKQSQNDLRPNIAEIAQAINSPEPFTAKICQQLVRENILLSKKGPRGGFYLEKNSLLKLADIVVAIDGPRIFNGCGLGLTECSSENPCPIHNQYLDIRGALKQMYENASVMDLSVSLEEGETFLKLYK